MRDKALYLNGVYESVLEEILAIQKYLPDQIMYLQPHRAQRIMRLAEQPPSVEDPTRLFVSVSDDLPTVRYLGEIVGWDDKRELTGSKMNAINRVMYALQPNQGGVFGLRRPEKPDMVNLLYVRRLRELSNPFSVGKLTLARTGDPHSTQRASPGGWSYVINPAEDWLEAFV